MEPPQAAGETKDPRAVERLLALASDPVKRKGNEIELGEALAKSGDTRAVAPIVEMIKTAPSNNAKNRLKANYNNLTGKDYSRIAQRVPPAARTSSLLG